MNESIGFIGLGVMGEAMARNLLAAGCSLHVWNRSPEPVERLVREGAVAAASPRALAEASTIAFICVSTSKVVEAVLFGRDGMNLGLEDGSLIIDCTTESPNASKTFAKRLLERGIQYLDAPVSGGDVGAKNGTLTFMVGGPEAALERARPFMEHVGSKIAHVGPVGAGQQTKAVNQIAVAINVAAMTEAMILAERMGLNLETTLDVLQSGAAGSWSLENYAPRILRDDLAPGFSALHMLKDLRIALDEAEDLQGVLPVSQLTRELYKALAQRDDAGELGNHALTCVYRELNKQAKK